MEKYVTAMGNNTEFLNNIQRTFINDKAVLHSVNPKKYWFTAYCVLSKNHDQFHFLDIFSANKFVILRSVNLLC
jgi:hypothetical protein